MTTEWEPAEATAVLAAMTQVTTEHGSREPTTNGWGLVQAAAEHIFGVERPERRDLPAVTPDDVAEAVTDDQHRAIAVELITLLPYADLDVSEPEVAVVDSFATVLGGNAEALRELHRVRDHQFKRLFFDYYRNAFARIDPTRPRYKKLIETLHQHLGDEEVASRYRALADHAEGTLGRTFHDFYRDRGFGLPGERHTMGEVLVGHDCAHILGGFNTDAAGEISVIAFQAGMRAESAGYRIPVALLLDYQMGIDLGVGLLGITPSRDQMDPDDMMVGLRRGMDAAVDLIGDWDFWADADQPVEELRDRYAIRGVEGVTLPAPPPPGDGAAT